MASANKATILDQLQETATRIKQYILQQIADLSDAVMAAIPETYAGSAEAGGVADKAAAIPYGHVDSTSTATAYTATIDGITELVDGTTVLLKNGVVTSKAGFTININGLGAKPVYNNMAAASAETTIFNVAYTLLLVYDSTRVSGGCWINYRGYYTDSNTVPTGYCTTAAGTAAKVATCNYGYRDDDAYFPCLFRYGNTAANATLAIASYATTAAPIYVNGARTSSNNTFGRGLILFLYHDGSYYTYNDGRFPIVVDGAVTSVQEYVAAKYTKPSGGIPASDLAAGVIPTVPSAATSAPLMDGTAAVGSSTKWAKEDHVHPSDTSKVNSSFTRAGGVSTIENTENTLSMGWYLESQQQDKTQDIYIEVNRGLSQSNVVIHAERGEDSNELTVSPTGTTIHKVVTPTADGDAANKKYVDDAVAAAGSLPSVTSSDNGKVLMVVNGAWAAGSIWEVPEPVSYIVTDQDLTAIADAIRYKGGTAAQLAFPAKAFASAIGDIQAGGGGATEHVLQAAYLPVGDHGWDFASAGLTASDFDRNSTTKMWLEATDTIQADVYLDEYDDDDFRITLPSGTIFECVSCQDGQSWKTALFAFAAGSNAPYGFVEVDYDKTDDAARIYAGGTNPSSGSAVQMPGFNKQNGGINLIGELKLELHILKY